MKLSHILMAFAFFAFYTSSFGQMIHFTYDWEDEPVRLELNDSLQKQPAVITKNVRIIEFYSDVASQSIFEYYTFHKKIRVNNEKAIENYNQVYISTENLINLENAKARVILPDGEIILFDKSNIKSAENLEDGGSYLFFPIDGIVKDAEVEILYTVKSNPQVEGRLIRMQNSAWNLNNTIRLVCPDAMRFNIKTYGDFEPTEFDSIAENVIEYNFTVDSLPPTANEQFDAYLAYRSGILYTLDRYYNNRNFVSYGKISENFWNNSHPELSKSTLKTIKKKLKSEIKIESYTQLEDKIRAIEDYIKTHYFISNQAKSSDVDKTLSELFTTQFGMTKITCAFLDAAGISYQMGLNCNRFELKFDKDFEATPFLQESFLYFPEIDQYLVAYGELTRLGLLPYEFTHNYALILKEVTVGDYSTAVGKVQFIEAAPASKTLTTLELELDVSDPSQEIPIQVKREMNGYAAYELQPLFSAIDEENKTELVEGMVKIVGEDATVNTAEVHNIEIEDVQRKPLIFEGEIVSPKIIEKAGDKYLFNIGQLIGQQSNLYSNLERQHPIENNYNRKYTRKIKVQLPENYATKNLEELNFEVNVLEGTARFKSWYELNGKELIVYNEEDYEQIEYPKEDYEEFKKVINAAADFNKITLVLIKE